MKGSPPRCKGRFISPFRATPQHPEIRRPHTWDLPRPHESRTGRKLTLPACLFLCILSVFVFAGQLFSGAGHQLTRFVFGKGFAQIVALHNITSQFDQDL